MLSSRCTEIMTDDTIAKQVSARTTWRLSSTFALVNIGPRRRSLASNCNRRNASRKMLDASGRRGTLRGQLRLQVSAEMPSGARRSLTTPKPGRMY